MQIDQFEWDWDAQEVRNSDRSLWLRRSPRREGMYGHGTQSERYAIFEKNFSVGFAASNRERGKAGTVDGWERDSNGVPITCINGLTKVIRFHPILDRLEELGPFQPAHQSFDTLERQERYIAILPRMLAVLPESFNTRAVNHEKAGGRIGYKVKFTKEYADKVSSGAFLQ